MRPVSYTHLDVYKRQVNVPSGSLLYANLLALQIVDGGNGGIFRDDNHLNTGGVGAVSYTHLDVYKRQDLHGKADMPDIAGRCVKASDAPGCFSAVIIGVVL